MSIPDYNKDLMIDPDGLDVEWLNQPARYMRYSELSAQARRDVDRAKAALDVVRATLDRDIRQHPDKFSLDKITESAVQSVLVVDPKYRTASDAVIQAQYEADLLNSAVRAFDQRKSALEGLVRLQGQGYFAAPSVPHDLALEARKRSGEAAVVSRIKEQAARRHAYPDEPEKEEPVRRRSRAGEVAL